MPFPTSPAPVAGDTHTGPGDREYKFDGTAWFPNTSDVLDVVVDDQAVNGYQDIPGTNTRMQWGVTNGTPSATFPTPFRAGTTPSVVPIPLRAGDNLGITLQAVDHLGFSCWVVRNESDVGTNPTQLHWHAIGLKP